MKEAYNMKIGSRALCQEYKGTVKYIGPVDGYDGEWIGMDWDDAERGKHDGLVNGKRYFTTRYPTSGSLVRCNKINVGSELVEAIERRYLHNNDAECLNPILLQECKKVLNTVHFEVVGLSKVAERQSNLKKLVNICVPSEKISHVDVAKLDGLCPSAEELILTDNLINDWKTVANIVAAMPNLRLLDLSKNIIQCNEDEMYELTKSFKSLNTLLLSHCRLIFEDVVSISKMMPELSVLKLAKNSITNIMVPDKSVFYNIKELSLDVNCIENWEEIQKLGHLENLEILQLNKVKLKYISLPKCNESEKCDSFINLKHLSISYNEIDNWRSISELNKLKNLKGLHFLKNPIIERTNYLECWSQIVARILNLTHLNHSEIAIEERRGAEYDMLKLHGKLWLETKDDPILREQFIDDINSYPALIERYGAPEASLCEKPVLPKSRLLIVNIKNARDNSSLTKKLPVKMTVQSLLGLIQKCFDTGNEVPNLYYTSPSNPAVKIALNNVTKNLDYFSIEDNDTIIADW